MNADEERVETAGGGFGQTALNFVRARAARTLGIRDSLSTAAVAMGHLLLTRGPKSGQDLVSDEAPIIVIGMHRSGTSLVSRLLERGGVYVGGSWLDENHESVHFLRANRAMFGEGPRMLRDFGWTAPKTDEFILERRGYAEQAARQLSAFFADRTNEDAWGWKDPRNTITLPVWLSIFPQARVVNVLRDGRSVALSLTDRNRLHPAFALGLWAHYVTRAEKNLEAVPDTRKITIRFEELAEDPESLLGLLYEFAGCTTSGDFRTLTADVIPDRASARLDDPRIADMGDHPLLARLGYT